MTLPNFLVIGAGNAGTTSLYHYLDGHPEVFMSPVKEPKFFALEGGLPDYRGPGDRWVLTGSPANRAVTDLEGYEALFRGVRGERAIGEASPVYLCDARAPERIARHVPDVKLVAVLRDPAERAYSAYMHQVRDGRETLGFAEALDAEDRRTRENWAPGWRYTREGFYHRSLSRYYELFAPGQISVHLYEDLKADPAALLAAVFRFLGVDDGYTPDTSRRHNPSGVPRSRLVTYLLKRPNPFRAALKPLLPKDFRRRLADGLLDRNLSEAPPLDPALRRRLVQTFREDVLKLQGLIGRDLSAWLRW